jgi:hypothetical protein
VKLNHAVITLLAIAAVGVQAQNVSRVARPFNSVNAATAGSARRTGAEATPLTMREHVQDMQGTLAKMHAVLDQMKAKAALNSRDPLAKANVDMWELMVGHLDSELKDLRVAMAEREQWEARRASLYKQADVKAQAEAQAAQKQSVPPSPR